MKVLVTGGAGFIGSHIVDLLIKNNHEVFVIDNLSTGHLKNINQKAQFYKADICDSNLKSFFATEKPEAVFHIAAKRNLREGMKEPLFYAQTNILGSINLLECCRKFDTKKIIYASSSSRFPESTQLPTKENFLAEPGEPYAISKYTVEYYLKFYKNVYDLDSISLGYSSVYGPHQDQGEEAGVIALFIQKMLNKQPPIIFGDGNQTRDFTFVEDAAEATVLSLNKTKSSYLNISTSTETSVNQIYFLIKNLTNFNGHPIFEPAIKGEKRRTCLDNLKAKQELNWKPKTELKEGLKRTIDYFKK